MSTTPGTAAEQDLRRLLGRRLRQQRHTLTLTLADVAGTADVSTGYLSSIENGTAVPSLAVLARIARAVGLTLAEVLRGSSTPGVSVGRIDNATARETLTADGSRLEVVRLRVEPQTSGPSPVAVTGADVFAYVVAGRLTVLADGTSYVLEAGDAVHCEGPSTLTWEGTGPVPSLSVWVTKGS